jgi:hypothetical protein
MSQRREEGVEEYIILQTLCCYSPLDQSLSLNLVPPRLEKVSLLAFHLRFRSLND